MIQKRSDIKKCMRCHKEFSCKVDNIANCQCNTIHLSKAERLYIQHHFEDCLCVSCMKILQSKYRNRPKKVQLEEGLDYYINAQGNWVFTAHYLSERGYCCKNGCKHCPYGYQKI